MKVLSLFAGIGGLDLGLEASGCTTIAYSEIDPYASLIMAMRFPNAMNLGDITEIDWNTVERPDIICGGFPCQDISIAGKGAGIEGERSGLWRYYANAIRVLRPRGVLVENVAALTSRGLDRVLGDLAACGYDAEWDCIPAAAVGAPHRRDRLFIVAYPNGRAGSEQKRERETVRTSEELVGDGAHRVLGRQAKNVAYTDGTQRKRRRLSIRTWPQHTNTRSTSWWKTEPNVGRVAHGIPNRMDRLRCLGNAVVPQVAEHVAHILTERIHNG